MNGINLAWTSFESHFVTFVMILGLGVLIMAKGIDIMIEAIRADE